MPGPHAAMLHTCDGVFQRHCDASKLHAMCCDKKFNMLNILLPILEYLSHLLSDSVMTGLLLLITTFFSLTGLSNRKGHKGTGFQQMLVQAKSRRITASKMKAACRTNPKNPSHSLIKTSCYPEFSTIATR